MIFTVTHIDTGYLNRPNWLLAGYSVYHRVASRGSQPTMFMTGPRSRHQRRCVRDANFFLACGTTMFMTGPRSRQERRCARDATDFYDCMMIHSRIEFRPYQYRYAYESFSKVYCDGVYFLCAERFETGSGFPPPAAPPST